jgi:hypothetical protein
MDLGLLVFSPSWDGADTYTNFLYTIMQAGTSRFDIVKLYPVRKTGGQGSKDRELWRNAVP